MTTTEIRQCTHFLQENYYLKFKSFISSGKALEQSDFLYCRFNIFTLFTRLYHIISVLLAGDANIIANF